MKRRLYLLIIALTILIPVVLAFRSQAITYWLTGPDYRIKDNLAPPAQAAVANNGQLISLDFIEADLSRLPFILNLQGHHLYGGRPFQAEFFPGGVILTNRDDKVGVMNDAGQIVVPFEYDRIRYRDDTLMATASGQPTVYYTAAGRPLFQTSQAVQTQFSQGLVYLSNGVRDETGQLIFNPEAPILNGWKRGVAAASNGREIIIYRSDGYVLARLPYPEVFDWTDELVLVGDGANRYLVNYDNERLIRLTPEGNHQFRLMTSDGQTFGDLAYDVIELLADNRLLLRHRLSYRYYDIAGQALFDPAIALLEPFQDGYSLSQSGGMVHIYHESGKLIKSLPGSYVAGSLSEGTLVVSRQSLSGQDSNFLYAITGRQLTYRPLSQILPRRQGISVVFEASRGIGYLRNEAITEWVFVPSQLIQAGRISLPIGLGLLILLTIFIRRYKL